MNQKEFEVIERYFKNLSIATDGVILGPGDDCAVLGTPDNTEICVSTDTLIEGVHFPKGFPARFVAHRVLAANLSDLAAMGAIPHSFVLAATLPEVDEDWLEEFASSLKSLSKDFKAPLVGGNLSHGDLSLTITVIGCLPIGSAVTRSGAMAGHDIHVTGALGDAGQGLAEVLNGNLDGHFASRFCSPVPRLETGAALRGVASSMIDISDGLLADLGHICEASQVGAIVDTTALPLSVEMAKRIEPGAAVKLALTAGDDYELCFTASPEKRILVEEISESTGVLISKVGQVVDEKRIVILNEDREEIELHKTGYQHFD